MSKKDQIIKLLKEKHKTWRYGYREIARIVGVSHVYVMQVQKKLKIRVDK